MFMVITVVYSLTTADITADNAVKQMKKNLQNSFCFASYYGKLCMM